MSGPTGRGCWPTAGGFKLLTLLVLAFFVGGVSGAFGFKHAGYLSTVPLALILTGLAVVPMLDDLGAVLRRLRKRGPHTNTNPEP